MDVNSGKMTQSFDFCDKKQQYARKETLSGFNSLTRNYGELDFSDFYSVDHEWIIDNFKVCKEGIVVVSEDGVRVFSK